jgi:transketolase C-terminal domain/subunit
MADLSRQGVLGPPYRTVLKPYGRALAELARSRPEVVCLSGDLTRQCEVDLFQDEFPDRFIHAGMAEANMIGVAGALARQGLMPFVHSFGVFTTRRALDQIVNAVAYPRLPVRIVGFMPGVSSPGGPSHQAIEDVALMRAMPGMTVIDVADATETAQVVAAMAGVPGPVYLRLKRGEIPVIFPADHSLSLDRAQVLEWRAAEMVGGAHTTGGAGTVGGGVTSGGAQISGGAVSAGGAQISGAADTQGGGHSAGGAVTRGGAQIAGRAETTGGGVSAGGGVSSGGAGIRDGGWSSTSGAAPSSDVALLVSGMMVAPALAAARVLEGAGAVTVVVNIPIIKPLDTATVLAVAMASQAVITAENHTVIGGLGSAVAEALAESGLGRPLRRIGLQDTFAEGAKDAQYLFTKYGLTTQHIVDTAWSVLDRPGPTPRSPTLPADVGEYAPV